MMQLRHSITQKVPVILFCLILAGTFTFPVSAELVALEQGISGAQQAAVGDQKSTKDQECVVVVDLEKIPDVKTVKGGKGKGHWPCMKTPNGTGGYKCLSMYEGRPGCNDHPEWSCTTINNDCKCQ